MLYGDIPAAWYNQSAFPQLYYVKLKGTNIRPDTRKLSWVNRKYCRRISCGCNLISSVSQDLTRLLYNKCIKRCGVPAYLGYVATCKMLCWCCVAAAPCNLVTWGLRDSGESATSITSWLKNCSQDGNDALACIKCDWWPARSSAPWYHDILDASVTCGNYFSQDGARLFNNGSSAYPCSQHPGYVLNSTAVNETLVYSSASPLDLCCFFQATCGLAYENGLPYQCNAAAGRTSDVAKAAAVNPTEETCCKVFVATCAAAFINGTAHQCPTVGMYQLVNLASTTVNDFTCCQFAPTCGTAYRSGASYQCPVGYTPRSSQSRWSPPSTTTCCQPDIITADVLCINSTQDQPALAPLGDCPDSDGQCCYQSSCGAVILFNRSSLVITGVAPYACPGGMVRNASTDNIANVTAEDCGCCSVTCGSYFPDGTAFTCSAGYQYNPAMSNETALYGDDSCCVSVFDTASCAAAASCMCQSTIVKMLNTKLSIIASSVWS